MKQQLRKKDRDATAFLYVRLSRDDNLEGDSYSIINQKKLLSQEAKNKGYTNLVTFSDDGISGVTMNRPGFNEMIQALENGYAAAVFVKDMSRLGRNYIEVGRLTEDFFPDNDIRLVAISDNIDSQEGDSDLTPIRNLFNEFYARDISKKRRLSNKIRGMSGEPLGRPPYGYTNAQDDSKRWEVDPEAAAVVRRVYEMTLQGYGTGQIAIALTKDYILTPTFYLRSKGIRRPSKAKPDQPPHQWNTSSVWKILTTQEYCGDVINFKTYSKSYKNKKQLENPPENWAVFQGVHEAIIEREVWEQIQKKLKRPHRKRPTEKKAPNMFSGLLICADCGGNLNYHFNQKNPSIEYFNCSNNNTYHKTCPTTHYIRVDFLEQVVLAELRRLSQFVVRFEDTFKQAVIEHSEQVAVSERSDMENKLRKMLARDKELDRLFEQLYKDRTAEIISELRFTKMSCSFEDEQSKLSTEIKQLQTDLACVAKQAGTTDMFMSIVRKYTRVRKLSREMLNEIVSHIEVYHAEKIDGVHVQKLRIHYNCIGSVEIPDAIPLSTPDVAVQPRTGVQRNYAPAN